MIKSLNELLINNVGKFKEILDILYKLGLRLLTI